MPICGLVVQSFEAEVDGRIEVMAFYEGLWCRESATALNVKVRSCLEAAEVDVFGTRTRPRCDARAYR